jgi:TnpA family transposase
VFNNGDRLKFFFAPLMFGDSMESMRTPTNKVCFIVMVGYFKARRKFFARQFHQADIEFVAQQIGLNPGEIQIKTYSYETYARHQRLILRHFGCSAFDASAKVFAATEIAHMVRVQFRPKLVLLEIIDLLIAKKIAVPSYAALADMIVSAIHRYQQELSQIIDGRLTKLQRNTLDALLGITDEDANDKKDTDEDDPAVANESWRYPLTLLKKPFQSTQPSKIKANLIDLETLLALYLNLKPVVDRLALRYACIRHYAQCVIKSQIPQVSRRAAEDRYLYLIAFIVYQTFRLNDTLIDTFLFSVQSAINIADKTHKETYYQEREQREQKFFTLADQLGQTITGTISEIKRIIADVKLSDSQKVTAIDTALSAKAPKEGQVEQQIDAFKESMATIHRGQDYYALLEQRSLKLQNRVADILRQVQFDTHCNKPALLEAILYYQQKSGAVDKHAPVAFLSSEEHVAVTGPDGKFRVSLYKMLLYIAVADAIKSGTLNLTHSEKYRSLDDYLIPKADWEANREEYLRRAELEKFADCGATLQEFNTALDAQYQETNDHFAEGDNAFLSLRANGSFHISTPKQDEVEALPLSTFFPEQKYISLLEALATVDQATGFLDEFEHWQQKKQVRKPPKKVFFAGIIGYGCDIGHRKLAQISRQINENELNTTVNWYFSLENIQNANDRILQLIDRMALPNLYRQQPDVLHTSSDGQKVDVSVDSLNASQSFKYFGQDKGASIISFIDMRHLLWYSTVITAAEREAAYVIDGLMHNDVIKSDIHSTDTHGYSEVIFCSTCMLGTMFAPRIKGVGRQRLYAFKNRQFYEEQGHKALLPHAVIRAGLIEPQWEEVLRFMATIKLKVATASQLFKRLNSYSKQHPLYRALKEFGRMPKSLFILKYVDDPAFRQSIEKQLNKVESSNRFSKAVSFGHNHEFVQSEKEDQEIAESCRRLIKNVIICWNYLFLARALEQETDPERKEKVIEAIRNGSVATWRHFNLHGEFDFSDEKMVDSVGLISTKTPPPRKS